MGRDYRDTLIEILTDLEAAQRARWRLERAALIDLLNAQRDEIARLKIQVAKHRRAVARRAA